VCLCEFIEIADEKSVEYRAVGDRSLLLQRGSVVVQLQTYIQRERERENTGLLFSPRVIYQILVQAEKTRLKIVIES